MTPRRRSPSGRRRDHTVDFAKAPAGPGAVNAGGFRRGGPCGSTEASRAPRGCPAGSPGPIPPCCGPIPGHRLARQAATALTGWSRSSTEAHRRRDYQTSAVCHRRRLRRRKARRPGQCPGRRFRRTREWRRSPILSVAMGWLSIAGGFEGTIRGTRPKERAQDSAPLAPATCRGQAPEERELK